MRFTKPAVSRMLSSNLIIPISITSMQYLCIIGRIAKIHFPSTSRSVKREGLGDNSKVFTTPNMIDCPNIYRSVIPEGVSSQLHYPLSK
jgi:hypothetical protein